MVFKHCLDAPSGLDARMCQNIFKSAMGITLMLSGLSLVLLAYNEEQVIARMISSAGAPGGAGGREGRGGGCPARL